MKIPAWSAFLVVPAIILGSAIPVIRRSESPWTTGAVALALSLVVAGIAWGVLTLLERGEGQR